MEVIQTAQAQIGAHGLTPREIEVLGWVAQGKSASEIGSILDIAKRTVDEHAKVLKAAQSAHSAAGVHDEMEVKAP